MPNATLKGEGATKVVRRLQQVCAGAFTTVMTSLRPGMTELDIADALREQLALQGINGHWYDVPYNVLIGPERFRIGTTTSDYAIKAPSAHVTLAEGQVVHADFAPMDPDTGIWGDWSSTCVFHPRAEAAREQLAFLKTMRALHRRGISLITASTTGAEVAQYYLDQYAKLGVTLLDVRNNVGHSMHAGPKSQATRTWLDLDNTRPLGPGIFTVEPGGISSEGDMVGRFEECILIPDTGRAAINGPTRLVPLAV
jgi:Xaa-Pro aminopeptidase